MLSGIMVPAIYGYCGRSLIVALQEAVECCCQVAVKWRINVTEWAEKVIITIASASFCGEASGARSPRIRESDSFVVRHVFCFVDRNGTA